MPIFCKKEALKVAGKEDTIKAKIAVEGEKEYREACKNINASLREIGNLFPQSLKETRRALKG